VATKPRTHPRIFALWFALLTFLVVSFLPVWAAWSINDWEGLGWSAPLFTVLAYLPRNAELEGSRPRPATPR
jgi:hypothetical protein